MKHDNTLNPFWKNIDWLPAEYRNVTNKFILVINDMQHAIQLATKNKVVFMTADVEMSKYYDEIVVKNHCFGKDDIAELIEDWKDLNNIKSILDKYNMFDLIVMNPPYDGSLHLKILEAVIPYSKKTVNVSPCNCYTSNRLKFSTDIPGYDKFVNSVFKYCIDLNVISAIDAMNLFNAAFGTDLGISTYDFANPDENYKADKFVAYANARNEKSICCKILRKCNESHWETYLGIGDFKLNTSHVHGHPGCADFANLLCMTYDDALKVKKTPDSRSCQFSFKTENERKNFYDAYMNSKVIHWWNSQWKNQIILKLTYIPYMQDYSQPWTDERFCEYFGIDGYVSDIEAVPGSEWETILNIVNKK